MQPKDVNRDFLKRINSQLETGVKLRIDYLKETLIYIFGLHESFAYLSFN